jgi:WD40 repeat protein
VVQAGHYAAVTSVCYSPGGKLIFTGSSDKKIILWRSSDGKQIRSFRGSLSAITHLEFSRQGNSILSLSEDGTYILWDLSTGEQISNKRPDEDIFTFASLSPDGTRVVAGSRKSGISVWNISTGEKSLDLKPVPADLYSDKGFDYPEAGSVYYSSDGQYIIAGVGDNTAILFEAKTGKEIKKYKNSFSCGEL